MTIQKPNLLVALLIIIMAFFYITTIRQGHNWGGDFSMYIHHAKNICEGIDYNATGYIYNPSVPSWGPKAYPPVFPLLLAPVYYAFGLNLTAMKIEIIAIFFIFLSVFFRIIKNDLPLTYSVAVILTIGLNPFFWDFKDNIVSDIPFLLFTYLTLMLVGHTYASSYTKKYRLLYSILAGLLMYLSVGTRSIGIVLIPCLFIYDIIVSKKPTLFPFVATLACILFMIPQMLLLSGAGNYSDQVTLNWRAILNNLDLYSQSISAIWHNGYSRNLALSLIIFIFASIGYLTRVKEGPTVFEVFAVLYMVPVVIWPSYQGTRFLIPIIPLLIFYLFYSIHKSPFFQQRASKSTVFMLLILAIFFSYTGKYMKTDFGPLKEGIGKKTSKELFAYIKKHTNKNAVFIFLKPRVLSLFTSRSASVYYRPSDGKDLLMYFKRIGVSYVVVRPAYEKALDLFIRKYQENFKLVYTNPDFKMYCFRFDQSKPFFQSMIYKGLPFTSS